jgi:Zn-dependent protease/CBS domain-containing protein
MGGSFTIGRAFGIDVRIHWSFFLLPLFVGFLAYQQSNGSVAATVFSIALILGLFVCVLLHEFGHSVVAQRIGVEVPNITLLPIGGVANLKKMPEKSFDEVKIAVAGPLVNVALAPIFIVLALAVGAPLQRGLSPITELGSASMFLLYLGLMNVALVVFNMLPAFPMDGGRVLRGLLATRLGAVKATDISATIGQVLAVVIGLGGLLVTRNPFYVLIGIFIFFGATGESQMVRQRETMRGVTVGDVMGTKRRTETVGPYNNLAQVMELVLHGYQEDFPVVEEDGRLMGMLTRREILPAANSSQQFADVREIMCTEFPTISPEADLFEKGKRLLQESGMKAIPVIKDGELVGMLTAEDISQASLIRRSSHR